MHGLQPVVASSLPAIVVGTACRLAEGTKGRKDVAGLAMPARQVLEAAAAVVHGALLCQALLLLLLIVMVGPMVLLHGYELCVLLQRPL